MRLVDDEIVEVGSQSDSDWKRTDAVDLGDVALLPGLVNAHTHLEFSDCAQPIGKPGIRLADWIGQVIAERGAGSTEQRDACIRAGVDESIRAGVTLIGDIATTPASYPRLEKLLPETAPPNLPTPRSPKIVSFAEVLGLSPDRGDERFASARAHARSLADDPAVAFGISPHAPYSTPIELFKRCVDLAAARNVALAMHVAESPDERELLEFGSGPFADSLRRSGLWRDGLFPWRQTFRLNDLIGCLAQAPRPLLIHGNDLRADEIERVSQFRNITVVYCPRTHDFFGYGPHPVAELLAAGVRVALGTDSRASNPDLSVWAEIQFLLNRRTDLDPAEVLRMGTLSGAEALLGARSEFGKIGFGSLGAGSLVAVQTSATTLEQVWRDFAERDLLCSPLG